MISCRARKCPRQQILRQEERPDILEERYPQIIFTYSQIRVLEYQRVHPLAHPVQTRMVIPEKALAGWLVANSGLCARQYPTEMSSLHFQHPVP